MMKRRLFMFSNAVAGVTLLLSSTFAAAQTPSRAEIIAARQKIFGVENVDAETGLTPRNKVVLSWITNSSFAFAVAGKVFYMDTHVSRLEVTPGRTPFVVKDLVDAMPNAILIGHGHSDHADNAAYIAAKTGATLYASPETATALQGDFNRMLADPVIQNDPVARFPAGASLKLVPVTTAGSVPGTQILRLKFLEPFAQVVAFRHLHSISVPPDAGFARNPYFPADGVIPPDSREAELWPRGTALYPGATPLPGQLNTRSSNAGAGGAVAIFYAFTMRSGSNFSFAYNDTIGALREGRGSNYPNGMPADGQRLVDIMKMLAPVDVYSGAVGTANARNNALRDLIDYQAALRPRIFIPNHQTTGGSDVGEAKSQVHEKIYLEQMQIMGVPQNERPQSRWTYDRADYLKPMVWDVSTPDKAVWALRQNQLRNFDVFPYADQ